VYEKKTEKISKIIKHNNNNNVVVDTTLSSQRRRRAEKGVRRDGEWKERGKLIIMMCNKLPVKLPLPTPAPPLAATRVCPV
jgi:hypothetical protein